MKKKILLLFFVLMLALSACSFRLGDCYYTYNEYNGRIALVNCQIEKPTYTHRKTPSQRLFTPSLPDKPYKQVPPPKAY